MQHIYAILVSVVQVLTIAIFIEYYSHRFSGKALVILGLVQWAFFPLIAAAIYRPLPYGILMHFILSALITIATIALCHFREDNILSRFRKRD